MKIITILSLLLLSCAGTRPLNLGVKDGKLAPLADKPNNVSTMAKDTEKLMDAIAFSSDLQSAKAAIVKAIEEFGSAELIVTKEDYIHAEFSTFIGWVDDVEFYIDETAKLIHFRSASRIGHSDFGTNRERMEEMTELIKKYLGE